MAISQGGVSSSVISGGGFCNPSVQICCGVSV